MMDIEIKNRFTGEIIVSGKYESLRDAVEKNGASLNMASLDMASLNGASLNGASLDGASLYGASLENTSGAVYPLISISGTMHLFCYYDGHITIGCEYHHLEYWLIMYESIGRRYEYTPEQIAEYGRYIKMCRGLS